ncbi:MAG: PQQ-dependent sugar dehydrogenase [Hyphomicrobiales bacterium]
MTVASCGGGTSRGPATSPGPAPAGYAASRVVSGLSQPVDLEAPPGDTSRVFVVEKTGTIRIVKSGQLLPRPFLDVRDRVSAGSEQGLLGLAFHPQYAANGRFYVDYTDRAGDTHVVEFTVSDDPDSASATEREILHVAQPYPNHNGGRVVFGPDGYLYIGLGDGGSGGDPQGNGQNLGTLLGKILRIDVGAGSPYAIPPDNPFVGRAGARGEIWSYGLRNPWRFSFDAETGDMLIGDVGQNLWEEVDHEPAGRGGRNYGWNRMEGTHCYPPGSSCDSAGLTLPVAEYGHDQGCSVTGGTVYRGAALPELDGTYFYGDYCTGMIRSFRVQQGAAVERRDWTAVFRTAQGGPMQGLSSFGVDARGELYLVLLGGEVYRIVRKS